MFNVTHKLQECVPTFTLYLSVLNAKNPAQKHFEKTNSTVVILCMCWTDLIKCCLNQKYYNTQQLVVHFHKDLALKNLDMGHNFLRNKI